MRSEKKTTTTITTITTRLTTNAVRILDLKKLSQDYHLSFVCVCECAHANEHALIVYSKIFCSFHFFFVLLSCYFVSFIHEILTTPNNNNKTQQQNRVKRVYF